MTRETKLERQQRLREEDLTAIRDDVGKQLIRLGIDILEGRQIIVRHDLGIEMRLENVSGHPGQKRLIGRRFTTDIELVPGRC